MKKMMLAGITVVSLTILMNNTSVYIKKFLLALIAICFYGNAGADSVWSCMATSKTKTLYPQVIRRKSETAYVIRIHDDGTMHMDNSGGYKIPADMQFTSTQKKAFLYDDMAYVTNMMYELMPGFYGLFVPAHWATLTFNKPMASATKAIHRTYADIQVYSPDDVFVEVIGKTKGKCIRTS